MPAESGKNKKYGRNSVSCQAYKTAKTQEKNQLRRMLRHCRNYGILAFRGDLEAAYKRIQAVLSNSDIKNICRENPRNMVL